VLAGEVDAFHRPSGGINDLESLAFERRSQGFPKQLGVIDY
jgi:hypothetical protein